MDDEEENWKIVDGRKGRGIKERDFNTAAYRTYKLFRTGRQRFICTLRKKVHLLSGVSRELFDANVESGAN